MIKLHFSTLDGIRKTHRYKTLAGARKKAHDWVGANADLGSCYAVSSDGVVTVTSEGCTLKELFAPEGAAPEPGKGAPGEAFWVLVNYEGDPCGSVVYVTKEAALAAADDLLEGGYDDVSPQAWVYDANGDPVPAPAVPRSIEDEDITW